MRRSLLLLVLVVSGLVVVAVLLRLPNVGAALTFLNGGYPTGVTVLAASVFLIWALLVTATTVLVIRVARQRPAGVTTTRLVLGLMVVASVAMLGFGLARHFSTSYSMCCGSIGQAQQQLANTP